MLLIFSGLHQLNARIREIINEIKTLAKIKELGQDMYQNTNMLPTDLT